MKSAILIILLVAFSAGCVQQSPSENNQNPGGNSQNPGGTVSGHVIEITANGFSPALITIKKGETVTWVNKADVSWPASNQHPTHAIYPGSGVGKCGTSEAVTIFDACRGISSGGTYSFTFNNVGEWVYHDHLKPSTLGTVVVLP